MHPPPNLPIGLQVNQAARVIAQAFDAALADAGGSLPVWLVMLNLKAGRSAKQRDLAAAVGIREATLTHHLNALERDGLVRRTRSQTNRRVQSVELTKAGEQQFLRLRQAAMAFDGRLTRGLSDTARRHLSDGLDHLVANLGGRIIPPWAESPPDLADAQPRRRSAKKTTKSIGRKQQ